MAPRDAWRLALSRPASGPESYLTPWTLRTLAITRMRSPPTCADVQTSEGPAERLDCSQLLRSPPTCADVQKSQGPVEKLDCSQLMATDLRSMFPDQKQLLAKLSTWRIRSTSALLERLQYQGPVELLTMHLCLILNTSVFQQGPLDSSTDRPGRCSAVCLQAKLAVSAQQFRGMGCASSWSPESKICSRVWLLACQVHVMNRYICADAAAACLPLHLLPTAPNAPAGIRAYKDKHHVHPCPAELCRFLFWTSGRQCPTTTEQQVSLCRGTPSAAQTPAPHRRFSQKRPLQDSPCPLAQESRAAVEGLKSEPGGKIGC